MTPSPPGLRVLDRACLGLLVALAAALAWAGAVPMVDHTTHRVLLMVDPIPWSQALRPFWNPEPMLQWALRPLSVLLLKLYADAFGPLTPPPLWLLRAKTFGSVLALGLGARAWLRAWGFGRSASLAMLGTVVLAPDLFSLWLLPELDTLGAAAVLGGGALLARRGDLGWRWGPAVGLVAFALFLKESSGLVQFAFLLGGALAFAVQGHRTRALRHLGLLVGGLSTWMWLASGTLRAGARSLVRGRSWLERLPIAEHNSDQFLIFVGVSGVAALALGLLAGPVQRRLGARGLVGLLGSALLGLCLLPPLAVHDHYASYYFSPRWLALGGVAVLALVVAAAVLRGRPGERAAGLAVGGSLVAVTAALLVASSPREDLAARLFLASAPALQALAWRALGRLWAGVEGRRLGQALVGLLALGVAWHPLAGGLDHALQWRAVQRVDAPSRRRLAREPLADGVVAFNHFVLWVDRMELRAAGAPEAVLARARFAKVPDWLTYPELPEVNWGEGRMPLDEWWQEGVPTWIFWTGDRVEGVPAAGRAALMGDLSWTRRDVGVFTPINYAPGDSFDDERHRRRLPAHNHLEDARFTTWREGPTPLQVLAAARGEEAWRLEAPYVQLPPELFQVPWRLCTGVPLVERHVFSSVVWRLGEPAGGS